MLWHEVLILKLAFVSATETCLKREDARYFQLSEKCYTSCCLFGSMHSEARVFKREEIKKLAHNEWKNSRCMRSVFEVVAIHENVLATRVTVKIATHDDLSLFVEISNHPLHVPVLWMQILGRNFIAPI